MSKRQKLIDAYLDGDEHLVFLEPDYFDDAILGAAQRADGLFAVCYSEPRVINALMKFNNMDYDEAMEFYQFNTLGSWIGDGSPVFVDDGVLAE